MKGTVPRPYWPAPAAKTATHSKPANDSRQQEESTAETTNRIMLALLEEHSRAPEQARGYDPYNATAARRPLDAWRRKPKRD